MHNRPATLEHVTFRLKPGCDPDAFVAAAAATGPALERQPGFRDRRLTRLDDGRWADLVAWSDLDAARAGAAAMMAEPAFAPFLAMIDLEGIEMRHDRIAWAMP
jgi:hypothetical protein